MRPNTVEPAKKDLSMPVRIENQACFFITEDGEEIRLCPDVTIITDSEKAMSAVEINGQRFYITEAEADALTVAGAVDGRKHLKASDSGSVI
jgi:alkylation response protein AidB-like acyl-CoA dehydrogenase